MNGWMDGRIDELMDGFKMNQIGYEETTLLSTHLLIHPSLINPSIHIFIRAFINTSIHLSVYSSTYPCFLPLINLSIHPSLHSLIHLLISPIHPSINFSCINAFKLSSIHPCLSIDSIHRSIYLNRRTYFTSSAQ